MKKKILFVGLSFIIVASLISASVMTSCSKTSTITSSTSVATTTSSTSVATTTSSTSVVKTTTTTTTAAAKTPTYGGQLTVLNADYFEDPAGWDPQLNERPWSGSIWCTPIIDWLAVGDIEKYGPRGNNAFAFQIDQGVPEQYLGGQVTTGWAVNLNGNPMTITFNIRHNIMWSGNTIIGMAPRELTADDVVYTFKRAFASPSVQGLYSFVSSITEPDKYTVVLGISQFNAIWSFDLMDGLFPGNICCPEWGDTTAAGGSEDWHNTVSDGPFILTDFVSGSGGTYKKNPSYWETTTINGKQYKLPFIDTLVYPIIPEESTAVAALRTAKIDWWYSVPTTYESSLNSTGMLHVQWTTGKDDTFELNRLNNQYLKNLAVRQALMKATDFTTIRNLVYPGGKVFDWPAMEGSDAYTPLNQMPANIQDLWTYDATKAKQMLSDAGYPNGFNLGVNIDAASGTEQDVAQLLAGEWAKVGITLNINAEDPTVLNADLGDYHYDLLYIAWSPGNFINQTNRVLSTAGGATYSASEPFDNLWWTMDKEPDPIKRSADEKALAAAMLNDVGWISMSDQVADNYWWPWINNYYQEIETGYENKVPMIERIWVDQSMKTSMGH